MGTSGLRTRTGRPGSGRSTRVLQLRLTIDHVSLIGPLNIVEGVVEGRRQLCVGRAARLRSHDHQKPTAGATPGAVPLRGRMSELTPDPVPGHGGTDSTGNGERQAGAGIRWARGTERADQGEPRSPGSVAGTAEGAERRTRRDPDDQAERRCRPLRRRFLRIARPARVDIRCRNPCLRARRRLLGW